MKVRKLTQLFLFTLPILLSLLLTVSCLKGSGRVEHLTLGFVYPLTGLDADFGVNGRAGSEIAIAEFNETIRQCLQPSSYAEVARNAQFRIGRLRCQLAQTYRTILQGGIRARFYDDRGQGTESASVVTRLADYDQVLAIVGGSTSTLALAASRVAQRRRVAFVSPSATNPHVTSVGDFVFRTCFTDSFQGLQLARYVVRRFPNAPKIAILENRGSAYSTGLADRLVEVIRELSPQAVIEREGYQAGDTHFSAQLSSITRVAPDVFFLPVNYGDAALILREFRALRPDQHPLLLGGDAWSSPVLYTNDDDAAVGGILASAAPREVLLRNPNARQFVQGAQARHHVLTESMALSYDATSVVLDAIVRAAEQLAPTSFHATQPLLLSAFREHIAQALRQTRNFPGATGGITINSHRDAEKPMYLMRVEANQFVLDSAME